MSAPGWMVWTPAKALELRRLYDDAKARGASEFEYSGHTLLVDYAKYLLEYLEDIYATQARREVD